MADLVAWSPIVNGKNTGSEADPKLETVTVAPGGSVTQADLGLDDDGWQQLLDSRAVRKMDYPDMPETFQGSPVEFLRHQAALVASDAIAEVETSEENISAIAAANAASTGTELPEDLTTANETPTATPAKATSSNTLMANEILASLDDINVHLPDDKAKMLDSDDNQLQIDVARYVRSLLSGFFSPTTLTSWDSPDDTPEIIRSIAGRLIAAKYYAVLYSEDIPEGSVYAQGLYNTANMMIDNIRTGTLTVVDVTNTPIALLNEISATSADFYPNDSAPGPFFTIDKVLS